MMKDASEMDIFTAQLKEWVKADRPKYKNYNMLNA